MITSMKHNLKAQRIVAGILLAVCCFALILPFFKTEPKKYIKHEHLVCANAVCLNDPSSKEQCMEFKANVAHLTVERADSSDSFRIKVKMTNKECQ